jgi:hypothetical protein
MESNTKKKCSTCKIEKDITEFSKDKHGKDGYTYNCKICRNKRYNDWAEENRDKVREKNRKHKDRRKEYYQSDKGVQSSRRAHLKRKYTMTLDEYNILLDKQNGVCDICGESETCTRNTFLAVDHCHTTNKVRGLLCTNCNRSIGLLKENITTLKNMINYIEKHKKN